MSKQLLEHAHAGISGLTPYKPGKPVDEVKREYGLDSVVKLASNENPLGPSNVVSLVLSQLASELGRYPDGAGHDLKLALSEKHGVDSSCITLGNGTNELLNMISRLFLSSGVSTVFSEHAFIVYKLAAITTGAKIIEVPAKNYGHDLAAMAEAISDDTRIVFLANPNNPTGTYFVKSEFLAFMAKISDDVLVVLDEAYFDYVKHDDALDGSSIFQQYDNLIVTRTFSKVYGLGGLRIGYALSSPALADLLNRSREPFNTNILAQAAAVAALSDHQHTRDSVALNDSGLEFLRENCKTLGLSYIDSFANFLTINVGDGAKVAQFLLEQGVIVRSVLEYGLPEYIRVTVGTEAENTLFVKALVQALPS